MSHIILQALKYKAPTIYIKETPQLIRNKSYSKLHIDTAPGALPGLPAALQCALVLTTGPLHVLFLGTAPHGPPHPSSSDLSSKPLCQRVSQFFLLSEPLSQFITCELT